jgi:UDP-glucose:(heptosyl)LPS alpha-1,3-glucosyltransferase
MSRFSIPDKDISVIYPAVDETQFRVLSKEIRESKRAALGVGADEFLVGLITSGNFKKRGVDRFFRAINLLPAEITNKCHFVFVGKDTLPPEFQQILDSGPFKDRVKLLPLIDNVEEYFNALDIFVLPARIEEFGRVVAEAMACGAPVITTNWVGASELMEGKSENFIYSGESDHELAQLMNSLLSDDELRMEVSAQNAKSASAVFESKLPDLFEKIIVPFIK